MNKNSITLKQARKLLGKMAENITDEELDKEIKVAELLKAIYFNTTIGQNKGNNGKA